MKTQPHIDELGRDENGINHDDAPAGRFELRVVSTDTQPNTYGHAPSTVAAVHAAIDKEDAASTDEEIDLFIRTLRMEKEIAASEKDRLLMEMADLINRIHDLIAISPDDKTYGPAVFAARMIAKHPRVGIECTCIASHQFRRTGKWSSLLSKEDVRNWKP